MAEGVGTKSADQVRHHARQLKRWKGPPHPDDHKDEHSDHHSDHSEHGGAQPAGGPPEPGAPTPCPRPRPDAVSRDGRASSGVAASGSRGVADARGGQGHAPPRARRQEGCRSGATARDARAEGGARTGPQRRRGGGVEARSPALVPPCPAHAPACPR